MPYFDVNIFGTNHNTHDARLFTFNLHILQVESDLSPTNFDMFIEFFAYPFNFEYGTLLQTFYPNPNPNLAAPSLTDRNSVNKPQVIHITAMTPSSPIELYDCSPNQYNTLQCTNNQLNSISTLTTPCPNPDDIRIFTGTFCVPIEGNGFNSNWTNMTNSNTGNRSFSPSIGRNFVLPLNITIIADGCVYTNKGVKRLSANIYQNYTYNYLRTDDPIHPFGNVDCSSNPKFYPIGYNDKVRVD